MELHHWVFLGSLCFVVAACANSAHLARRHLITSGPRDVRSFTVRILLMVPLYSIESWLALVLRAESDFNKVLALVRKGCESVVVISFVGLLLAWLGGPEVCMDRLDPGCCRHLPPLSFVLPSWAPASRFVRRTLTGVLQNAFCSIVAVPIILASWCAGSLLPRAFEIAQPFCLVLMNLSQFIAVYCVVTFYHANKEPLAPLRPVQKLLSIKGLVFCLFWQEAAIRVAERAGVFDDWLTRTGTSPIASTLAPNPGAASTPNGAPDQWTVSQVAWGLLNSLICLEMFLLSCLHRRLYPPGEATRLRHLYGEASAFTKADCSFDTLGTEVELASFAEEVSCGSSCSTGGGSCSPTGGTRSVMQRQSSGGSLKRQSSGDDWSLHIGDSDCSSSSLAAASVHHTGTNGMAIARLQRSSGSTNSPTSRLKDPVPSEQEDTTQILSAPHLATTTIATPVRTRSCSLSSEADDDPALSGTEPGWQVLRRLLLALDLSDIPRFYQHLSRLSSSHREPAQDLEHEAFATAAGSATVRNRASGATPAAGSGGRSRMFVV